MHAVITLALSRVRRHVYLRRALTPSEHQTARASQQAAQEHQIARASQQLLEAKAGSVNADDNLRQQLLARTQQAPYMSYITDMSV